MFFVAKRDERWMGEALAEARRAMERNETPVGAVVEYGGQVIGRGSNRSREWNDPTAHAEIIAIREAAKRQGRVTLNDATLYVTVEPCVMCAGAIRWARLSRVVYGIAEPKFGGTHTRYALLSDEKTGPVIPAVGGCRAEEAKELMRSFFQERRDKSTERCVSG